jgi:hypothetical protein
LSPITSSVFLNVRTFLSLVFEDLIQIFGYPPTMLTPPAAIARRLAGTSLVSGFHPTSFREHSSDHRDSDPKKVFSRPKPQLKLSSEPFEVPGTANEWLCLAVRRGQAFRLLRPRGSKVRLDCFVSLSSTTIATVILRCSEAVER